jgi:hypothetical protein
VSCQKLDSFQGGSDDVGLSGNPGTVSIQLEDIGLSEVSLTTKKIPVVGCVDIGCPMRVMTKWGSLQVS